MSTFNRKSLHLPLLACVLFTATAEAQIPGGIIQTGSLTVSRTPARPVLTVLSVLGGAVDIHAAFDDGAFEMDQCRPCVAGTLVGVGGRIVSGGKGNLFYDGDFALTGPPIQVPGNGFADLVLTGPFRFEGRVIASPSRHSAPDEKEPAVTLEGGGTVTVTFTSSVNPDTGDRLYFFRDATYRFSPSSLPLAR